MVAVMLVATVIVAVYVALIAMHVLAIRGGAAANERYRPRIARWLAGHDERRRGRAERDAVHRLAAGTLDRASYRSAMAALAAQDAVEHPIELPKTKM
ncbi:hypothetical protein ACFO1B_39125 [Dactylosporangium siamense]|uniref:Uncharacterized protein n=1 Tax=Dactylosporangium siamense TaxID=685454 RepID=A0A919UH40_9ACTN|nr:hypothetical protein [Dactylosporangium siamense]GIG50308.1 hypothetical protein Dsi01nite_083490 [Dactylosporangium siamense]